MQPIGMRAQDSLRLEKGYGVWSLEFAHVLHARDGGARSLRRLRQGRVHRTRGGTRGARCRPAQRLVLLSIDAADADVTGFEPVWHGSRKVGFVTSGAYGHYVEQSLALAYVDTAVAEGAAPLSVHVVGERRAGRILTEPPYDPKGLKLRG